MLDTRLFPPDFRGKYPHMFPEDLKVWERFLDRYGSLYTGFYYDITCGEKSPRFPSWKPEYKKDAAILSRLRIDAVGVRPATIDIIEIKPRGNMAAMGQVLTYMEHYKKEYKPKMPLRGLIVCGEIDPNIITLLEKNHLAYTVV